MSLNIHLFPDFWEHSGISLAQNKLTSLIFCKSSVNSTRDSKFFMTFCKSSTAFLTSEKANYNCCAKHDIRTRGINILTIVISC